jgi:hypothetical protein
MDSPMRMGLMDLVLLLKIINLCKPVFMKMDFCMDLVLRFKKVHIKINLDVFIKVGKMENLWRNRKSKQNIFYIEKEFY